MWANLRAFISKEKAEADPTRMADRARESLAMVAVVSGGFVLCCWVDLLCCLAVLADVRMMEKDW